MASAGVRISGQKSKVVHIGYGSLRVPITIGEQQVEEVVIFTYLGNVTSLDRDAERDVVCHIGKASAPFQQLAQSGISSPCRLNCGS